MTLPGAAVNTSPKQDVEKLLLVAGEQKRGVSRPRVQQISMTFVASLSLTFLRNSVCSEKLSQMKVDEFLKENVLNFYLNSFLAHLSVL